MQDFSWLLAQAEQSPTGFTQFNSGDIKMFALMGVCALVVLLSFGILLYDRIHRRNAEFELKRDMLDRGLSADEIERILAAKASDGDQ